MTAAADDRRDALAELLALVSSVEDADEAFRRGLVFTARAVEAEFCAIVRQGSVVASDGFRAADVPVLALVEIAEGRATVLEYGGFGNFESCPSRSKTTPAASSSFASSVRSALTSSNCCERWAACSRCRCACFAGRSRRPC